MSRILNLDDRVKCHDEKEFKKPRQAVNKSPKLYTEVEFRNEFDELLFTTHNELLLPGGLFLLEKISNVSAPIKPDSYNKDLDILPDEADPGFKGLRRENAIFGFTVGIGGCTDVFDTVKPVYFKERKVEGLIPMRKTPVIKDLSEEEKTKFSLRRQIGDYYEYYIKHFESEPTIHVEFDEPGSPSVPQDVDTKPGNTVINTYIQFTLKINKDDVREFFKLDGGGLNKARVNTLSLVYGYPTSTGEYQGVRSFSKLNFNNEPFDNESKELIIIYKIYV